MVSQAREKYNYCYHEEIELNLQFKQFVNNYKVAFEGKNSVQEQVGVTKRMEAYSEFSDLDRTKPSLRFLPLGRSFQQHVAAFGSHEERSKNPKEKLLKQLEISFSRRGDNIAGYLDMERQTQLDIKCLQILRAIIYNQIILINAEDRERDPPHYRRMCAYHVHPIQNEIQDLGNAILRLIVFLSHPNEKIVYEVLALLETLLFSGNHHLQDGLEQLQKHDHRIFPTLKAILKKAAIDYEQSQLLVQLHKTKVSLDKKIATKFTGGDYDEVGAVPIRLQRALHLFGGRSHRVFYNDDVLENRIPFSFLFQFANDTEAIHILRFYDLSRIELISSVLGLMCDGHFKFMQNFLREQIKSIHSFNMVNEIAYFFCEFSKKQVYSMETLALLNQLHLTLLQFCTGNYRNREVVYNANIISRLNYILQIDITTKWESDISIDMYMIALQMKFSVVQLLDALLEETHHTTSRLSMQIAGSLDITALHHSMYDFFILKGDRDVIEREYDEIASRGLFISYKILMNLADISYCSLKELTPTNPAILLAWDFCTEHNLSIEVVYRDDESEELLTRVHFNLFEIREKLKDTVKYAVDRSTHAEKLQDFNEWMFAIKKDTSHHEMLKRHPVLNAAQFFSKLRYWLFLLVTLILNILLIVYYKPSEETSCPIFYLNTSNESTSNDFPSGYVISTFILGSLHAILVIWIVAEYVVVNWPHFTIKFRFVNFIFSSRLLRRLRWTWSYDYLSINIFGVKTIYLMLLLAISASPVYCFGYLYCFSFLYIIVDNQILKRSLQSVSKNWKSLLWVAILLLVVVYIYAIISFGFLRDEFEDPSNENVFCETIDQCFISVLRFGLIDNLLGVGVDDAAEARNRFFYDVSFFIIVTIIGTSVVFGIIVDTFSELREARLKAEQDMRSKCFICGLPSYQFDKFGINGFLRHIRRDHNMWAYVYYSIYLDSIDVADHTAIESYVYRKIRSGQIDYIPFERALVLEGLKEEEDEQNEELKQLVKDRFDALENLIQASKE